MITIFTYHVIYNVPQHSSKKAMVLPQSKTWYCHETSLLPQHLLRLEIDILSDFFIFNLAIEAIAKELVSDSFPCIGSIYLLT